MLHPSVQNHQLHASISRGTKTANLLNILDVNPLPSLESLSRIQLIEVLPLLGRPNGSSNAETSLKKLKADVSSKES